MNSETFRINTSYTQGQDSELLDRIIALGQSTAILQAHAYCLYCCPFVCNQQYQEKFPYVERRSKSRESPLGRGISFSDHSHFRTDNGAEFIAVCKEPSDFCYNLPQSLHKIRIKRTPTDIITVTEAIYYVRLF